MIVGIGTDVAVESQVGRFGAKEAKALGSPGFVTAMVACER